MSPDVLLECPRTSFRDVLRVNVTERVWIFPGGGGGGGGLGCVGEFKNTLFALINIIYITFLILQLNSNK